MDLRTKALRVIECLCYPDFKFKSIEDLQVLIYKYAHVAEGSCGNKHEEWAKDLEEEYKQLVANDMLPKEEDV